MQILDFKEKAKKFYRDYQPTIATESLADTETNTEFELDKNDELRLIVDDQGSIKHLMLAYDTDMIAGEGERETLEYQNFIEGLLVMMPGVSVTLLVRDVELDKNKLKSIIRRVAERRRHLDIDFIGTPNGMAFRIFVRDYFSVLERWNKGVLKGHFLVRQRNEDSNYDGIHRKLIKKFVQHNHLSRKPKLKRAPFTYMEGNMLITEDILIVGKQTAFDNDAVEPAQLKVLTGQIKKCLGPKHVIWLGETGFDLKPPLNDANAHVVPFQRRFQPINHLDLFLSIAGKNRDGVLQVIVGELKSKTPIACATLEAMQSRINAITETLVDELEKTGQPVKIYSCPLILHHHTEEQEQGDPISRWYLCSYNNCLLQNDPYEGSKVWLPSYASVPEFHQYDLQARLMWESLDFEVKMLPDSHVLARLGSGVRCLSKVLSRR